MLAKVSKKEYSNFRELITLVSKEVMKIKIKLKDPVDLRKLIMMMGYSQRSFGKAIGISAAYTNQILNEVRNPSPIITKKIMDLLEVDFDEFFFVDNADKSNHGDQKKTS